MIEQEKNVPVLMKRMGVPERFFDCSFDNFIGNDQLVRYLQDLTYEKPFPTTVLVGKTGCGKTHLSIALLRQFILDGRDQGRDICFIPAIELLLEIRRSFNSREITEFEIVRQYTELDLLILDDLGAEKISEWTIATLYLILNKRYNNLKSTIITTNLDIPDLEAQIGSRIASRLSDGRIIKIDMPDFRKKRGRS